MRIALYHNLPSGGAKRSVAEHLKRLARRHTIHVYTLSCADHDFADLRPYAHDHRIFPFRPLPLFRSPFGRLNQLFRLVDLFRLNSLNRTIANEIGAGNYDLVCVHPCQFSNAPSLLTWLTGTRGKNYFPNELAQALPPSLARPNPPNVPVIFFCHEVLRRLYDPPIAREYRRKRGFRHLMDRLDPLPSLYHTFLQRADGRAIRAADVVLANSYFTRETVLRFHRVIARVCYWSGVDAERFRPLYVERRAFVLSVGALRPAKGFDFLIESIALIPSPRRPPLVVVCNYEDPMEKQYLLSLANRRGVQFEVKSRVHDETLITLYNQAAVVAYTPFLEPFGLVPLEAMACATPVVAVAEGGIRETIVHEQTGFLLNRDPAEFAEAIQELLANESLNRRLGEQGREYILSRWSWDLAVERLEAVLEKLS
ncbi:MAG: glycosyltransferase family 4 protein [Candidatus Methanomethyliaceae archaeon]